MVPGDGHDGDPRRVQPAQRVAHQGIGVAGHEDGVDALGDRDPDHLVERGLELPHPRPPPDGLPDVPVTGVQEPHAAPEPTPSL